MRTQSNRRTGFRINLSQIKSHLADRLCVTVAMRQGQVTAKPIDLSLTGICVESSYHFGRAGAMVDIILDYGQHHAVLPAIVVRHEGAVDHTAFHFVDSINDGEADPTPELGSSSASWSRCGWTSACNWVGGRSGTLKPQ
ncbi:MAG: PilZ domain-containing protein [Haliea sp.]|nr:PilZ domain-containing protein [Haliea sp.]